MKLNITTLATILLSSIFVSASPILDSSAPLDSPDLLPRGADKNRDRYPDKKHKFLIKDFYDSGSPHSLMARVYFTVSDISPDAPCPPANITDVACYASLSIQPSVAFTQFGTPCAAPGVSFGLQFVVGAGYYLSIVHSYNNNKTVDAGTIWLGSKVDTYQNPFNPNGNYQYLNHSTEFELGYNRVQAWY